MTFGTAFERIRNGDHSMWRGCWEDAVEVWAVMPETGGIYNVPVLAMDSQYALETWIPSTADLFAVDWEIRN